MMRSHLVLALILLGAAAVPAFSQPAAPSLSSFPDYPAIPLWDKGAPGTPFGPAADGVQVSRGDRIIVHVQQPTLTPFLPAAGTATGAAVIIAPGGGHMKLSIDFEGNTLAKWLSQHGVAAFVLKYRLSLEPGSTYTIDGDEMNDMRRAVRLVRSHAGDWHIDPDRLGVMGFSAGGLLAANVSWFDAPQVADGDAIDRLNARPAFTALVYPNQPKMESYPATLPPAFLLVGEKDSAQMSVGLPTLYLSLKQAGVPVELHVLTGLGHGFGIRETSPPHLAIWPTLFLNWLDDRGFLKPLPPKP